MPEKKSFSGTAYARIGLLGNPSDVLMGRVLSMTFQLRARARAHWGPTRQLPLVARTIALYSEQVGRPYAGPPLVIDTEIPRQSGLSGSSAIVVATLRALCAWHDDALQPELLALLAVDVERGMGMAGGMQDQVIQSHEGVILMDFACRPEPCLYPLDPETLPPLLVSWPPHDGAPSSEVHGTLTHVLPSLGPAGHMGRLGDLAWEGRRRLLSGERDLRDLFDENLRLRGQLMSIAEDDLATAALARDLGCGAKLAGSGGAVIATAPDPASLEALAKCWQAAGRHTLVPEVSTAAGP